MKTNVQLGCLTILVEADDYKDLVRQAWRIARLNEAATQEGIAPDECLPYAETGADGNEYCGFVHIPTGKRIRFGQQKAQTGGDWFVRGKDSDSYRGLEQFGAGDTSRQLPPAANGHTHVSGKAKARPEQDRQPANDHTDGNPAAALTAFVNACNAAKDDPGSLGDVLREQYGFWVGMPDQLEKVARQKYAQYEQKLADLESAI